MLAIVRAGRLDVTRTSWCSNVWYAAVVVRRCGRTTSEFRWMIAGCAAVGSRCTCMQLQRNQLARCSSWRQAGHRGGFYKQVKTKICNYVMDTAGYSLAFLTIPLEKVKVKVNNWTLSYSAPSRLSHRRGAQVYMVLVIVRVGLGGRSWCKQWVGLVILESRLCRLYAHL